MKFPAICAVLLLPGFLPGAMAAENPSAKDEIKALVLEDAKKAAKAAAPAPAKAPAKDEKKIPAKTDQDAAAVAAVAVNVTPPSPVTDPAKAAETAVKLPQVDVNKNRVTQLDHDLQEQDQKMAFEAKNAKSTELDRALNSPAVNPTILGGYSTKVRTGLAQERLELMEFEKELREMIARAKTKKEKAELTKQLDDIRAMRRELDRSPDQKER
jgi:hypothetical protein